MTSSVNTREIRPVPIEEEMKSSYLDYAMSVIVSRALPDVRDGLKPVHRRILYAMKDAGNDYNKPYRKSARVVGDVMGKYHPHGNAPIYEAMVRMTQDFSLRLPLIDGQGNFGSMDGDPPAAERYTEARLARSAHDLLEDIDKNTVDFQTNYDDTLQEPKVLPARFPNLLVNGTSGIAVGMATYIPTHNLGEVIDACVALIKNPEISLPELMNIIPGPDFPTGGTIMGRHGIMEAFRTGRGSMMVRGKTSIEKMKGDREAIIIHEIPFQVNKAKMVEKIADLVKEKIIEGISDLRDESDRDGVRVVIELKRDAVADVVLNQLYRYSPLQTSISFNMLALVHGRPEQLSLKRILEEFLSFREEVILRRTRFELAKAREKAHTLLGFAVAVANIDPIIALIRSAADRQEAKEALLAKAWDASVIGPLLSLVDEVAEQDKYKLSEIQANAILDLRLHRLTSLERDKIRNDLEEVVQQIQHFLSILASRQKVLDIMESELLEIRERFATPRRTEIEEGDSTLDIEDLIQREDMVITVSVGGYIKRVPLSTYRAQKRGGRGRSGMTTKDEDVVQDVIVANTHSRVLFFSTLGKVYQLKVYRLPLGTPTARGRAMVNLLPLSPSETISTVLVMPDAQESTDGIAEPFFMFATSIGNVRRNRLSDFENIPSNGKRAMKLDENEDLISVMLCTEAQDVLLSTQNGLTNRFNITDVRIFAGRDSNGVRGIRLQGSDRVISMAILDQGRLDMAERDAYLRQAMKLRQSQGAEDEGEIEEAGDESIQLSQERFQELNAQEQFILTLTENGYGKRSSAYEYRTTNRGSQGFTGIAVNKRNGGVVASFPVLPDDHIMLVTDQGRLIRCPIHDVRITRRSAQGVIIFRVDEDEKVVSVSRIPGGDEDDTAVNEEE
jgi:DNA gyrase subunit A